jgi:RHS repeat-associated protein
MYDNFGNTGFLDFTGDRQIIFSGLFDTPNREELQVASRWLSPDPAGDGWNLYAYPTNPNTQVDPSGLTTISYSIGDLHNCGGLGSGPGPGCAPQGWVDDFGSCFSLSCVLKKDGVNSAAVEQQEQEEKLEHDQNASERSKILESSVKTSDATSQEEAKKVDNKAHNQSSGGFFQKLGNWLNGNGYKTNDQVIGDQRQWLSDNKIVGRDAEGKEVTMDWSKASAQNVTAAYGYVHDVMAAANANHVLSVIGIAATVTFQSAHGMRHLEGTGLKEVDVQAAIRQDIEAGVRNSTGPTGSFWGRVNVGGYTVEYRAYTLPNGTINVGTTYIP